MSLSTHPPISKTIIILFSQKSHFLLVLKKIDYDKICISIIITLKRIQPSILYNDVFHCTDAGIER